MIHRNVASLLIGTAFFLAPLSATALAAGDIATQIQSLLQQVRALQAQLAALTGTGITASDATSSACLRLYRTLSRGASGSDVVSLQAYLISEGDLSVGSATGFFGPLTESAVQRWQARNGVVSYGDPVSTGYGVVGSITRAALAAKCRITDEPITVACPLYQQPLCGANQHVEPGTLQSDGCYSAPRCVNNQTACPIYNACPAGYATHTSTDANGCLVVSCVSPSAYSCTDSGKRYNEGDKLSCIFVHDDARSCVADAYYVCRSGAWKIEGSLPSESVGIRVSTPSAGQDVEVGDKVHVDWSSSSAPLGSYVGLYLVDADTGYLASNEIADRLPSSGLYTWTLPNTVILTDLGRILPPGRYQIEAVLFPSNYCVERPWLGTTCDSGSTSEKLSSAKSGVFTVGGGPQSKGTFSVWPQSGTAPLTVQFSVPQPSTGYFGGRYIDPGDGSTISVTSCAAQSGCKGVYGHTYQSVGTYTAYLMGVGEGSSTKIGSVTITVR